MNERLLLYFSGFIAVIAFLSFFSDFILALVHGFSQAVFEGNSTGKTIAMLSWFFLLPLIAFALIKFNLTEKIRVHEKKFLIVFLVFAVLGYSLGLTQFLLIASEFSSLGPFATIAEHNGVIDWQASKLSHNHFPKASIYFLESLLGIESNGSFDDGFPWYNFIPDAANWSIAFLLIELIVFVSGLLFINSVLKKISFFDFIVFLAGFLAVFISVLDGGIASGCAMMAIFFLSLFFSRNYLKIENHVLATLLPLFVIAFVGFADVVLPVELGNNFYASSMILFFGLSYYFFKEKKSGKMVFNALNILLFLLLLGAFFLSFFQYLDFSFGREINPNYFIYGFQENASGGGIFVYGLPSDASKAEADSIVSNFGEIVFSDKTYWSYYALILPERNFRTGELELLLKKKFEKKSYLYVEQVPPSSVFESYRIEWFSDVNSSDFIRNEFLGDKVVSMKDDPEKNSTELIVEEKMPFLWGMASILSEIKGNGFTGKVLLIKNS